MLTLLLLAALAAPPTHSTAAADDDAPTWDVNASHGPSHSVQLDLREGTWISVDVRGDTVLFDLLGDLWSLPLTGGEATRLTSGAAWDTDPRFSPDGARIAFVSDRGGNEQIWMMAADGSGEPSPVTHEDSARVTEPLWLDQDWMIVRRRTVDTRSIGVTELYKVHLRGGKGIALTHLDAQPHAGEPTSDGRYVYFSSRHGRFQYNHDPVAGLWDILRLDLRDGEVRPVARGAGSAGRPLLLPDGRLSFISRDRTRTLLEILDLATGQRRVLADWLSPDGFESFGLHGTYPSMALTDAGDALVLWAQGKLWRVSLADGARGEIPFHAQGDWVLHDVQRPKLSLPDTITARVIRWPTTNDRGQTAFSAMGRLWSRAPDGSIRRLSEGSGYSPSYSPDGRSLAWTSWSDTEGGALQLTDKRGRTRTLDRGGQMVRPAFSPDGQALVYLRGAGGGTSPDTGAEAWYDLVWRDLGSGISSVVTTVDSRGSANRAPRLSVHNDRVWFMEDVPSAKPRTPSDAVFVSVARDGSDKRVHLRFVDGAAEEVVPSPDFRWLAYKQRHQLHIIPFPDVPETVQVEALPDRQVTQVVGDWLDWSPDSDAITWMEGPVQYRKSLAAIYAEADADEVDDQAGDENPDAADALVVADASATPFRLELPRARPTGSIALVGGRVITMKGDEVLERATIIIEGDRITAVGKAEPPPGAEVVDISGKTVMPGLIDVHAHLHYAATDITPVQPWQYQVALDYGVTTVQDPSASTDTVFTQAEAVATGLMKGPRVFSTGMVLYGALSNDGAPTPSPEAARAHVRRMRDVGAHSVKVYQQSQRERRQWYVQACEREGLLCVPEGGGDLWQDLSMVVDGFDAIEHSLPVSPLYADVRGLFAASHSGASFGTAYTPTLLVAYGGLMGENWYYQHANPLDDARLRRHWPARQLDAKLWRQSLGAQDDDWRFRQIARDAAGIAELGGMVTLGAHGQLQGLGAHWELWALGGPGALSPIEALRAGTLNGARYLGLDSELGSVEVGKRADLIVLDANPLDDLHNSVEIAWVIKNGERWGSP